MSGDKWLRTHTGGDQQQLLLLCHDSRTFAGEKSGERNQERAGAMDIRKFVTVIDAIHTDGFGKPCEPITRVAILGSEFKLGSDQKPGCRALCRRPVRRSATVRR